MLFGHQLGHYGLPGGGRQSTGSSGQEYEQQQQPWSDRIAPYQYGEQGREQGGSSFSRDQEFAFVDDVGERARGKSQQQQRQIVGHLHHRHRQRIARQVGHQPSRRGAVHPPADIRHHRGGPH